MFVYLNICYKVGKGLPIVPGICTSADNFVSTGDELRIAVSGSLVISVIVIKIDNKIAL